MSKDDIRDLLAKMCRDAGSQAAWAAQHDVSAAYVSDVLQGRRPAGAKILIAMGVKIKTVIIGVGRPRVADPVGKRMSYRSWNQIIQRCNNPKNPRYKDYGGRGITVCERWLKYTNFVADMGEPPFKFQIERVDNDAGYSPENCIWADTKTQQNNRRPRRKEAPRRE